MSHSPDPLLGEIESFLTETRMTPTAFGRDALSDPGFVFGLRFGRDCRRSTTERARAQMARYRAEGSFASRVDSTSAPEAA
jgi:homoserine dehydrogenase